jgi:LacI family transcriptional regulator
VSDSTKARPTIQDVAQAAGVSRAAVSKVIRNAYGVSPSMRERVTTAIDELGYRPNVAARSLRGSSFTLGIELPTIGNPFFSKVIAGATRALAASPYQLVIAPVTNDPIEGFRALEALADRHVDGIVAISPHVDQPWLERLGDRVPLVMLGRHDVTDGYDTLTGDDLGGAAQVMQHLLSLGHQRIAHLSIRRDVGSQYSRSPHAVRAREYERLMTEAGLGEYLQVIYMQSEDEVQECTRKLLRAPDRPTAIFAGHDTLALDVMRVRDEEGLGPAQLSIVGYDDIEMASHPALSLTTVDQFGFEMGERAIRMLLERIDGRSEAVHHQCGSRLMVRGSTVPLNLT